MATTKIGKDAVKAPEPAAQPAPKTEPKTEPATDIDARMAALLKDHQAMGARPK